MLNCRDAIASKNISVFMVTGGAGASSVSVELLSSNGTRLCSLPNLTMQRYQHSQTGLLSCGGGTGGDVETTCETFADGRWKKSHTLGTRRQGHTAWASPQGVLLMGGTIYLLLRHDLIVD